MNTTTQPPQGVMAELRELLAADWHDISDEQVRAMHRALPGLLDEVEALRAELARQLSNVVEHSTQAMNQQIRADALLARCEGLDAERDLAVREHQAFLTAARAAADSLPLPKLSPMKLDCYKAGARAMIAAINAAFEQALAATRTTGGE